MVVVEVIYIVQLIKSNRVDIKVALYCELKSIVR